MNIKQIIADLREEADFLEKNIEKFRFDDKIKKAVVEINEIGTMHEFKFSIDEKEIKK